jgi:hypothetical protein
MPTQNQTFSQNYLFVFQRMNSATKIFLLLWIGQAAAIWPFTSTVDVGVDGSVVAATPPQPTKPMERDHGINDVKGSLSSIDLGGNSKIVNVNVGIKDDVVDKPTPGTPGPDGKLSAVFVNNSPLQVMNGTHFFLVHGK